MIELLYKAQSILRKDSAVADAQREATLTELRAKVPPPILAHYLRLVASGRNGIAIVRHGVCCECHIRVPVSTIGSLLKPADVYLCENCGCYLMLPPGEDPSVAFPQSAEPKRRATAKRPAAARRSLENAAKS